MKINQDNMSTYILLSNFMKINKLKNTVHNYDNSKFINSHYSKILNLVFKKIA